MTNGLFVIRYLTFMKILVGKYRVGTSLNGRLFDFSSNRERLARIRAASSGLRYPKRLRIVCGADKARRIQSESELAAVTVSDGAGAPTSLAACGSMTRAEGAAEYNVSLRS